MEVINLVVLLSVSVANLTIGLLSYLKNSQSLTHKLFALLTATLVGWSTANYISVTSDDPDAIFWAVKMILFFVVLQNTVFLLFVNTYPGNTLELRRRTMWLYLSFSVITLLVALVPGYFSGYELRDGATFPQASPFILFFMLHTLVSIAAGIGKLYVRYRRTRGIRRNQFKFLVLAGSVLLLIAPFTNFALPTLFEITFFIPFSALYTLAFAVLVAYSMVKHQLLDFRLLVAKTFVYVLTLGVLGLTYAAIVFGISSLFFAFEEVTTRIQVIYTILALLLALTFHPMRRYFDKLSNKFFFRDTYDSGIVLNELSQIFAEEFDVTPMTQKSLDVLRREVKVSFARCLVLKNGERVYADITSGSQPHASVLEKNHFDSMIKDGIIVVEEMKQGTFKSVLNAQGVAIVVPLTNQRTPIGLLLLGEKQSGSMFNEQDREMLSILSNEMAIAVENAKRFEEIENFNVTLQQKVDTATSQLRKSNSRLRLLDETKDDFVSMASHQLRTPLTSVKGYISMVLEGDAGKVTPAQRKMLEQAFVSSQRMTFLIADLLNVSRLRTGKFVIDKAPVNLAQMVEQEVAQLKENAKSRDLTLTYNRPSHFPELMLDETKTRQVIMNFADNAIYYTPAGGKIEIKLEEKPKSVELTVADNGIGIPKHEHHHLFTKFYRATNAKRARPDGTGLGLFMAKKVIVAQGGAIIFRSEEGKGSTFGFSFPKKPAEISAKTESKK